jgi:hypothetical protein
LVKLAHVGFEENNNVFPEAEVRIMVFNSTFNSISVISWQSLLMEETEVPGENQRPVASY